MKLTINHNVITQAVEYFIPAAEQGFAEAQFSLGYCYYFGKGVEKDCDKAAELYALAAEQGHPTAMFALGDCYYEGKGAEKNWEKAAEWYQKSLDAGYAPDETDQAHLKDVFGK